MDSGKENLHSLTKGCNTVQGYKECNQCHYGHLLGQVLHVPVIRYVYRITVFKAEKQDKS